MIRTPLTLAAATLVLGACVSESGTRYCGTFDLPRGERWTTLESVGEAAVYRDADGEQLTLTLLSREDNEPYEGYDRFGAEDVVCNKRSTSRYALGDGEGLEIELAQSEGFEVAFEDQPFFVTARVERPAGEPLGYGFQFRADDPIASYGEGEPFINAPKPEAIRVSTDPEIGGVTYPVVIEDFYTDIDFLREIAPGPARLLSGVAFADGGGLVRIDYSDGASYTRVAP